MQSFDHGDGQLETFLISVFVFFAPVGVVTAHHDDTVPWFGVTGGSRLRVAQTAQLHPCSVCGVDSYDADGRTAVFCRDVAMVSGCVLSAVGCSRIVRDKMT